MENVEYVIQFFFLLLLRILVMYRQSYINECETLKEAERRYPRY